jgi:hypothetical protein
MDAIRKKATRFAEANTYLLDNSYLNQGQKMEVELWFQFPWIASYTTFCACLIYHSFYSLPVKVIIGLPLAVDILVGIVNWHSYSPRLNKAFFLSIGHNFFQWFISLSTIGVLIYHEYYWWAVIVLIGKLGLIALFSPSIFLYPRFARKYKMHPKYAFFKKYHDEIFPFEEDYEDVDLEEEYDEQEAIDGRPVRELSRTLYNKFIHQDAGLTERDKLTALLMDRYPEGAEFHDLANSNRAFLTDLQSLLSTIINMEFPNGRETEGLALQYYEGLDEFCKLGHVESKKEMKNLRKIMEKASENGLDEVDGLFISFKSGLLHKRDDFQTILSQLKW